jgi:hypothetical protein
MCIDDHWQQSYLLKGADRCPSSSTLRYQGLAQRKVFPTHIVQTAQPTIHRIAASLYRRFLGYTDFQAVLISLHGSVEDISHSGSETDIYTTTFTSWTPR